MFIGELVEWLGVFLALEMILNSFFGDRKELEGIDDLEWKFMVVVVVCLCSVV